MLDVRIDERGSAFIPPRGFGSHNRRSIGQWHCFHRDSQRMKTLARCALITMIGFATGLRAAQPDPWIASWTASPEQADPDAQEPMLNLEDQTIRERVRLSVGGSRIRIRLSNEFGTSPLLIGSVTVGVPRDSASVSADSIRVVTFGRRGSITIPSGAPALSDPVDLSVPYGAQISISLYLPKGVPTSTWHQLALRHAVVSPRGDHTHDGTIQGGSESVRWLFLSAVLVPPAHSKRVMVAFGDSLVDGDASTIDADHNWPGDLIRRLSRLPEASRFAVVNQGIAGNRLLGEGPFAGLGPSALARFDRDALSVPGVTHIVLLEGVNDLGFPGAKLGDVQLADARELRAAEDLIGAYRHGGSPSPKRRGLSVDG
jgi:lysophospholipase L1-like esterase